MSKGRLIGIGVGPGDPKLMTLAAVEAIRNVDLVAYLAADDKDSLARQIAAAHLAGVREQAFSAPMRASRATVTAFYDETAEWLARAMAGGADVGFLCLGDPLFYGSFCYLLDRLRDRFTCNVVPGITSISAASARALTPLATQRDKLSIFPAGGDHDQIGDALDRGDCVIVMKLGEHFPKIRRTLQDHGKDEKCWLAADVGWPNERVIPLSDWPHETAPYMAVLMIPASSTSP